MRLIVAGPRDLHDPRAVDLAMASLPKDWPPVTEIVTGGASGVDALAESWSRAHHVPCRTFPAPWRIGPQAGPLRNHAMAIYADACLAIQRPERGLTAGTRSMVGLARTYDLHCHVFILPEDR